MAASRQEDSEEKAGAPSEDAAPLDLPHSPRRVAEVLSALPWFISSRFFRPDGKVIALKDAGTSSADNLLWLMRSGTAPTDRVRLNER